MKNIKTAMILLAVMIGVSACGSNLKTEAKFPNHNREHSSDQGDLYGENQTIFGEDGLSAALGRSQENAGGGSPLGVNKHLWRASLDTISFMPIASADPFGGVIVTDWYASPEAPNERNKLNIFITDKELRAGALRVTLFKEARQSANGQWQSVAVSAQDTRKIEDAILTRARERRIEEKS